MYTTEQNSKIDTKIFRKKHQSNYTVISNSALCDPHLSFKARGILSYLLGLPDDWIISTKHLAGLCQGKKYGNGRHAVLAVLRELRAYGYVEYVKSRDEKGRYIHEYFVYEDPKGRSPKRIKNDPTSGCSPEADLDFDLLSTNFRKEKVNDSARERTPFEAENTASPSVTRPIQAEEDEQPRLELTHPSVPSASPEELEMMRLLDQQFSKLEQELPRTESQVPKNEQVTTHSQAKQIPAKRPLTAAKKSYSHASRRPKPAVKYVHPQKSVVRIVSGKSRIASVFRGPASKITSFAQPKPCVKRYMPKLSQIQSVALEWLRSKEIDTSDETLQYWASKYGLSRLQDVYREAVRRKARSIGAYMHALLKKGAVVMTDFIAQNAAFTSEFKKSYGWRSIEINDKYAIIHLGCIEHEVNFNMHPEDFIVYLNSKYNSFRGY